jgi:hypothetical protein
MSGNVTNPLYSGLLDLSLHMMSEMISQLNTINNFADGILFLLGQKNSLNNEEI